MEKRRLRDLSIFTFCFIVVMLVMEGPAFAKHPLITDDTETQGKGKTQLELNGEVGLNKQTDDASGSNATTKSRESEVKAILSYGIVKTADVIITAPHQWRNVETDGVTTTDVSGPADLSLEVKWRFYEKEGLSFAVKPGFTLPTGDKEKDLGTGRTAYTFFFIASKEKEPWEFHANLGYKRNENDLDQRKDIWHASLAAEWEVLKNLELVANIGVESNTDRNTNTHPAFILGGIVYSITKNFDIDAGLKGGLNKAENDYTLMGGLTFRF